MNDVGLNLVELRATKGGEVTAFRRFFRLWAFLTCRGGRIGGHRKEKAREGLKMGNWGVWRATERCRTDVLGCISPPMGRVVGVWLGAALRWRRMVFNGRLNSV